MSKKYKLKRNKRSPIIILFIVLAIVAVIIIMNTGYSLWQTKLNINGRVILENEPTDLEVTIMPTKYGYTVPSNLSDKDGTENFIFISDEYEGNNLTTTLRAAKKNGNTNNKKLNISFDMKNISNNGDMYTNGSIENENKTDHSKAISKPNINLSSRNISVGNISTIRYSSTVNLKKITQTVSYKYKISFDVNGRKKYFYYTIVILPYAN